MRNIILYLFFMPVLIFATPIVDINWLESELSNEDTVVLDVRSNKRKFIKQAHIPGARLISFKDVRADINNVHGVLPKLNDIKRLLENNGVKKDSNVIITYEGNSLFEFGFATRLYWTLKVINHKNVSILNGGNLAWSNAKKELTFQKTKFEISTYVLSNFNHSIIATTEDVMNAQQDVESTIIDARTLDYYLGLLQRPYVEQAGHILIAKTLPFPLLFDNSKPRELRDIFEIESIAKGLNIDLSNHLIFYCDSGHLSSIEWFVFHEMLEIKNVKLYDASMAGWKNNPTSIKLQ